VRTVKGILAQKMKPAATEFKRSPQVRTDMSQVWSFDQCREGDWCLLSFKADTGWVLAGSTMDT
jgi:hypothetical protein